MSGISSCVFYSRDSSTALSVPRSRFGWGRSTTRAREAEADSERGLLLNDLSPPSHHENRRESGRSRRRTRSTRLSARCRPALGRHHDGRPYPFSPAAPEPVARAIVPTDVEDPPRKRDRPLPISLSVHPSAKRGPRRPGAAPSPRPRPSRRAATTAPICSSSSTWPSSRPTRRRAGASSPPSRCGPPRPPSRRP